MRLTHPKWCHILCLPPLGHVNGPAFDMKLRNSVDWAHQHIAAISPLALNFSPIPVSSSPSKSKLPGKRCPRLFWHYFQMSIVCDLISSSKAVIEFRANWVPGGGEDAWNVGSNAIKADNTIQINEVRWGFWLQSRILGWVLLILLGEMPRWGKDGIRGAPLSKADNRLSLDAIRACSNFQERRIWEA